MKGQLVMIHPRGPSLETAAFLDRMLRDIAGGLRIPAAELNRQCVRVAPATAAAVMLADLRDRQSKIENRESKIR